MANQSDDRDEVSIGELMGEHRLLPGEGEAMFAVEEIATANTVLRGARVMIEDRLGEEIARPLSDVLRWAQSIILSAVLDDDLGQDDVLEGVAEMLRKRLGDGDDPLDHLPYGPAVKA